jgi:hypothetical protein
MMDLNYTVTCYTLMDNILIMGTTNAGIKAIYIDSLNECLDYEYG